MKYQNQPIIPQKSETIPNKGSLLQVIPELNSVAFKKLSQGITLQSRSVTASPEWLGLSLNRPTAKANLALREYVRCGGF